MFDFIILGAGIVGLSTAYNLSKKYPGKKILVIEKENSVAKHQTGNNSGVIHSGIYYKPGSLKATNCRKGYEQLLQFCDDNEIKYDICGKVITAVNETQLPSLNNLYERGIQNGLKGLRKLSKDELKEFEPHVTGVAALHVPETGIIDYKIVSAKFHELLLKSGCEFKFDSEVKNIISTGNEIEVQTGSESFHCKYLISCCGLQSDRIAKKTNPELPLRIIPFRGEYYKIRPEKRYLVKNLVYPVPDPAFPFLGVHFTRMINGEVEAGPNAVLAFKREGYTKFSFNIGDTALTFLWPGFQKVMAKYWKTGMGEFYRSYFKSAFVKALQQLIPEITGDDLIPGGSGIRAQACDKTGGLLDDFYFAESKNITHVCNAPSPAATASLAIGEYITNSISIKIS
ncbi:MAG: L-2-hydroxyglutarate oxidase [bacterium]